MRAALALNCEITKDIHFDRKNYFYPDNPKAYQITQAQTPIGTNGWLEIELEDGSKKKIGIEEMHVEEDAGEEYPQSWWLLLRWPKPTRNTVDWNCF